MMDGWFGDVFAFIGAFFVFGTFWFFIVTAAIFGWLIWLTEQESNFLASLVLLGTVWAITAANGFSIIGDPVTSLKWAGGYLAVGVIWSFVKWFAFLVSKRRELKAHKENYIERFAPALSSDGKITPEDMDDFIKFLNDRNYTPSKSFGTGYRLKSPQDIIPAVANNVKDLTRWVAWWPFSVTWTLLNDALRKLVRNIVRICEGAYARLANSMFSSEI